MSIRTLNGFPVERRKLTDLVKAPWNPRRMPEDQAATLRRSLAEFGTVEPIVVNKTTGHVVGGHMRLDALKELGEVETDVLVMELPEEREKALNIALNRISGQWDEERLGEPLKELQTSGDVGLTGFSQEELADLLSQTVNEGLTDPDEIPEAVETRCKTGDIWQLGEHRLLCGDSTKAEDAERLMNGQSADICVTSPPYWVGKEYEKEKSEEEILLFINVVSELIARNVLSGGRIVINTATTPWSHISGKLDYHLTLDWWQNAFRKRGWLTRNIRIWLKHGGLFGLNPHSDLIDIHWEFLCAFWNPSGDYRGQNKVGESWALLGYWDDVPVTKQSEHSAPFNVEIPTRYLRLYSESSQICYEPFAGSGTTIIACEQLGRRCFAMEIDEHYCDVAIARWEKFTGKTAVLLNA